MTASIARTAHGHQLTVHGKPFIALGAQVHNSSAWPERLPVVWPHLENLGVNTAEFPIYWNQVEPTPREFDFSHVDAIVLGARERGLKLVLLWFGTWKNGVNDFVPDWVKEDPATYPLMQNRAGASVRVMSPHFEATRDADARAFAAFMSHLGGLDADHGTVIMVQVQNEPGSLFTDRDHSPTAEELFAAGAPSELTSALGVPNGGWHEAFPEHGHEAFQAYAVARYVNYVAEAGREPMTCHSPSTSG